MRVAVVGIDCYSREPLRNAVNDARGVLDAFEQLGFERASEPLLDGAATRAALFDLVTVELKQKLGRDDSLVLFFAGHGLGKTCKIFDLERLRSALSLDTLANAPVFVAETANLAAAPMSGTAKAARCGRRGKRRLPVPRSRLRR